MINKTIITSSTNNTKEKSVWLVDGNKFLNFERKIGDQIFGIQYFELKNNHLFDLINAQLFSFTTNGYIVFLINLFTLY